MEGTSFDNGLGFTDIESCSPTNESDQCVVNESDLNNQPDSEVERVKPCLKEKMTLDLSTCSELASNVGNEQQSSRCSKEKCIKGVQAFVVCTTIGVVLGLLTLPIVFYALPVSKESQSMNQTNGSQISGVGPGSDQMCSATISYDGSVCQIELESWRQCLPDASHNQSILIQQNVAQEVQSLIVALNSPFLGASEECKAAAVPFLCVHFFGLCDSTGRAYRPSSSQCTEITSGVCARAWSLATSFGAPLPDCASLPDESILSRSCEIEPQQNTTNLSGQETNTIIPLLSGLFSNNSLQCSNDFFFEENETICKPECGSFSEYSPSATVALDVLTVLATCIGILSGVAVLVIAGIRWKRMFTFPSILIVYQTVTLLTSGCNTLLGYSGRRDYLCGTRDLFESYANPTPFCCLSGILSLYTIFQFVIWTVLHITAVFWLVQFPLHANAFKYTRYVHGAFIAVGVLVPLVPVIATMVDGHLQGRGLGIVLASSPPNTCSGTNLSLLYFTLVLPINILLLIVFPLLILTFWNIHKKQGSYNVPSGLQSPSFKLGTAEKKILAIFTYYTLLTTITLTNFTIGARVSKSGVLRDELLQYFLCEQSGYDPNNPCDRSGLESLRNPTVTILARVMLGIAPAFNLIFVISVQGLKKKLPFLCQFCFSSRLRSYLSRSTITHP